MTVDERRQSRRIFLLTFAVAFLLMALGALLTVFLLQPEQPVQEEAPAPGYHYLPREEDAITILLVIDDPATRPTFLLAGFYPEGGRIPLAALPGETLVNWDGRNTTLQEVWSTHGIEKARASLAGSYGLWIARWGEMTLEGFQTAFNAVGTVDYRLASPLQYRGETVSIALPRGLIQVDGARAADLIRFPAYENGESQRCRMTTDLLSTFVNHHLTLAITPRFEEAFRTVVNQMRTDVTFSDFVQRTEAAAFLARLGINPAYGVEITGWYNEGGNTWNLDEESRLALRQAFPSPQKAQEEQAKVQAAASREAQTG